MDYSSLRPQSPTKSSGLPRLSKLPTPQPSRVTAAPHEVQVANTARTLVRPTGVASKSSGLASPTKTTSKPPSAVRRASGIIPPSSYAAKAPVSQYVRPASPTKPVLGRSTTGSSAASTTSNLQSTGRARPKSMQIGLSGARQPTTSYNGHQSPSPSSSPFTSDAPTQPRKVSQPSLADRTKESLAFLPDTPASDRRRSGIFTIESSPAQGAMRAPGRPASALAMTKRTSTTSVASHRPPSPIKKYAGLSSAAPPGPNATRGTPMLARRSMSAQVSRPTSTVISTSRSTAKNSIPSLRSPVKTTNVSKQRTAVKPAVKPSTRPHPSQSPETVVDDVLEEYAAVSPALSPRLNQDSPKSSSSFRRAIERAKAANKSNQTQATFGNSEFGGFHTDPFNQRAPRNGEHALRQRIKSALSQGKLNISNLDLGGIPDLVLHMYDSEGMIEAGVSWSETVDLTSLIASGNKIPTLDDSAFPDVNPEDAVNDDNLKASVFAGVERIDLRDNQIMAIPIGLRHLQRLTVLNLSRNQLGNAAFESLSFITTLRELHLANNNISGFLPQSIAALEDLEILDVSGNRLLSIPECIRDLSKLRKLNVAGNQLTGVPMDALEALPLTELDVSSNALVGALFPFGVSGLNSIQELNVSNNSLASLAFSDSVSLPNIQILKISNNRIVSLPDLSGWSELVTLAAGGNKLATIPQGFASLRRIRLADFSSNDITRLDERVALMDSLESLAVSANPLVDRKFLTMSADAIKRDLRSRLEPDAQSQRTSGSFVDEAIDVRSPEESPSPFKVTSNGALDLNNQGLVDDDADGLRSLLGMHDVRELQLARNKLSCIPYELSLAQNLKSLDLSMCELGTDFVQDNLALPCLQDLQLSGNKISSLEQMMNNLHAPYLRHLDLSHNRLTGSLPTLRASYPHLIDLFAPDNKIESVSVDALKGLHTVILARNNIMQLPAEIGLLWFEGLKGLDVSGNAFRVPNHMVLQKGTEAVLAWLRDRILGYTGDDETF